MRPARNSRPGRGACERTSSDPNRRILRVLPVARPSAALWKMVSTIRRASLPVTPPWTLRTAAARSALVNVETRSFLLLQGGRTRGIVRQWGPGVDGLWPGRCGTGGRRVLSACGTSGWSGSRPRFALLSRTPFCPPPAPPSLIGFPGAIRDRKVVRPSRSQSAASSALVSRSRAMPVGDRRSAVARCEGGGWYAVSAVARCEGVWDYVVRPPPAGCAGLKTGVPGRVRHPARGGTCRDRGHFADWLIAVRGPAGRACRSCHVGSSDGSFARGAGDAGLKTGAPLRACRADGPRREGCLAFLGVGGFAPSLLFAAICGRGVMGVSPAARAMPV